MKLILIGYRGTGKTTVSDLLHDQLDIPVYHCDEKLEERLEMKVVDFVNRYGWHEFRAEEELLLEELCELDDIIIDTGGGVVIRESNRNRIKQDSLVVWLKASVESIASYIGRDRNRPPLTENKSSVEEIEEVLAERIPYYESLADLTVRTDTQSLEECVEEIIKEWKKRHETMETGSS